MRRRDFLCGLGGGIVAAKPCLVLAQQHMPTVGVVTGEASRSTSAIADAFLRDLEELGWQEGRNYEALFLWHEGHIDRIPALVKELANRRVNVIVVIGFRAVEAAQRATTTIPVVGVSADLVKTGFAESMGWPRSNITGVNVLSIDLDVKRLELLHEAVPTAKRIGVLADPAAPSTRSQLDKAAHDLGLKLSTFNVRSPDDLDRALDALEAAHPDAVNVLASQMLYLVWPRIIERLNQMRVASIFEFPDAAKRGALLGYGAADHSVIDDVAALVAKILHGARPEDLPIEQPEKIDLAVNVRTAKALGIEIPASILARADEVIE
jgi:putative ABC transport system substrate-binding protein